MVEQTRVDTLRNRLRWLRSARGGNVTIIFALAMLPVAGAAGAAVDYSRANSVKSAMQAAIDSTALMLAREVAGLDQTQLDKRANDYFKALFNRPEASNITIKPTYTAATSQIVVTASGTVKTSFMGVMGIGELIVSTTSTAKWGATKLRVVLALDNTGSMSSSDKIGQLKIAAKELLKILQSAAQNPGDIQVAIIPFANGVNVGTSEVKAPWIDWSYYKVSSGGFDSGGSSGSSGSWDGKNSSTSDYSSSSGTWSSSWNSTGSSGKGSTDKSKWQGCVMDRDQDYDVKNTPPTPSIKSTLFPAIYAPWCPASLMPLSYDWTALNAKIDTLIAVGSGNQTIGLAWAWQALSPGWPFSTPTPPAGTRQVIILLSDGLNTENRWTTDPAKIDARMQKVCDNVKAANIQIYTVLVMSGNSSVLQKCASSPNLYFQISAVSQMVTTFKAIGTNLSTLRIAQ